MTNVPVAVQPPYNMKVAMFVEVHYPFPQEECNSTGAATAEITDDSPISCDKFPPAPVVSAAAVEPSAERCVSRLIQKEKQLAAVTEKLKFQQSRLDALAELATSFLEDGSDHSHKPKAKSTIGQGPWNHQSLEESAPLPATSSAIVKDEQPPKCQIFRGLRSPEGIMPSPNDVIFGKGARLKHPGNEQFRAECQRLAPQFLEYPTSSVKHEVAQKIVSFVYRQGGRFLIEDREKRGTWKVASFDIACKKARQLLADVKKKKK